MRFGILKAARASQRGREELGDYDGMFKSLLAQPGDIWDVFEVKEGEFPENLTPFDGMVITGSPASAYDDEPWIHRLTDIIREAYQKGIPLLGVCFGHQIVAQALGGEVTKNPGGWDLGLNSIELTQEGRQLELLADAPDSIKVLEVHQDIVFKLPPGAVNLAQSPTTKSEMYHLGERVFCLQGHPEMDNEEVRQIITKRDWLPADRVARALETLDELPNRAYFQKIMIQFLQNKGLETQPIPQVVSG